MVPLQSAGWPTARSWPRARHRSATSDSPAPRAAVTQSRQRRADVTARRLVPCQGAGLRDRWAGAGRGPSPAGIAPFGCVEEAAGPQRRYRCAALAVRWVQLLPGPGGARRFGARGPPGLTSQKLRPGRPKEAMAWGLRPAGRGSQWTLSSRRSFYFIRKLQLQELHSKIIFENWPVCMLVLAAAHFYGLWTLTKTFSLRVFAGFSV